MRAWRHLLRIDAKERKRGRPERLFGAAAPSALQCRCETVEGWPVDPAHLRQGEEGSAPESTSHAVFIPCFRMQVWKGVTFLTAGAAAGVAMRGRAREI